MATLKTLRVSELIQNSRPLTGTASLHFSLPSIAPTPTFPDCSKSSDQKPLKTLTPLTYPSVLIGTLTLPTAAGDCCFQFSDGSATICCDILDFDVRAVGKQIHVLSWNFIPLNLKRRTGFLEIIKWKLSDPSAASDGVFPLFSDPFSSLAGGCNLKKPFLCVHGVLEFISYVSSVPCSGGKGNLQSGKVSEASAATNVRGFILQILVCECKLCRSSGSACTLDSVQGKNSSHFLSKPLFVYMCGSASAWHPVFSKLIGNIVTLSGLKKKLVFMGKKKSCCLMFVSTDKSALHFPVLRNRSSSCGKSFMAGKIERASYTGVVKGVYMQGMVVELDENVWLLVSDQLFTLPHSLRSGALISVRNAHFVNPKFSWTKILILGACFKTNIVLESFSPLETGCHFAMSSWSLLGKFVDSLVFPARLWALLVVSCLRRKFAGILSEKEILGSKHKEGLAQIYARSCLPPSAFQTHHEVFTELCKHDACGHHSGSCPGDLKLVVPISIFVGLCESKWMKMLLGLTDDYQMLHDDNRYSLLLCEGKYYDQAFRWIFTSEDIGVVLLGTLKISPSSGRLQLVDGTGSIDVFVRDLPSTWSSNSLYEVRDYSVIVDGKRELVGNQGLLNDVLSCGRIFESAPLPRGLNLAICITFCMRDGTCRNVPFKFCAERLDDSTLESGTYHLLKVSHKFPLAQKFQDDLVISNKSSMFVETILLPWNLFLDGKDEPRYPTKGSRDWHKEPMQSCTTMEYREYVSMKRQKTANRRKICSASPNDESDFGSRSSLFKELDSENRCDLNSQEFFCLVTISTADNKSLVNSGILYCTESNNKNVNDLKSTPLKMLLECNHESVSIYQRLQSGSYYILKHDKDNCFCSGATNSSSFRVNIDSRMPLWSLSFSSNGEILQNNVLSDDFALVESSSSSHEFLHEDQTKLPRQNEKLLRICSDICLYLSTSLIDLIKADHGMPNACLQELTDNSWCIGSTNISPELSLQSLDNNGMFPEGNLVSLHGLVMAVHNCGHHSADSQLIHESLANIHQLRSLQRVTSSICIHLLSDNHIIKILGSLSRHVYPVGFGPGVNATFHRILDYGYGDLEICSQLSAVDLIREQGGQDMLMLTSVSSVVINSIRAVGDSFVDKFSKMSSSNLYNVASPELSSGLISEMIQCLERRQMQFCGRIIAIHVLILEKKYRIGDDIYSTSHTAKPHIDIPVAAFVLDDGSSSCCCWTDAERAALLLRLHDELPHAAFESTNWTLKWVGRDKKAFKTNIYHLKRILNKYNKITVKNYGSSVDSLDQDYIVTASSDSLVSNSDENLLKIILLDACHGKSWNIVGKLMESDAVRRLENQHQTEMEITDSMQNIWVSEVQYLDPVSQAKNLVQELLHR